MEGAPASGSPSASPSQPRKRKPKASPEKRAARTVPRPSRAVEDRIERAFSHRLYLLRRGDPVASPQGPLSCEFHVLGNTGNAYTVTLAQRPSCTCPDSLRGNVCKHRLFVMLRVLRRPRDDRVVWQKALLSSELQDLLGPLSPGAGPSLPLQEDVLADSATRAAFELLGATTGGASDGASGRVRGGVEEEAGGVKQRELEGDCPVCYEPFAGCAEEVVFCRSCGNNLHRDCFEHWRASKAARGSDRVTCVWCRAPWVEPRAPGHHGQHSSGDEDSQGAGQGMQYLNLAQFSQQHRDNPEPELEEVYPETFMHIGGPERWRKRRRRDW